MQKAARVEVGDLLQNSKRNTPMITNLGQSDHRAADLADVIKLLGEHRRESQAISEHMIEIAKAELRRHKADRQLQSIVGRKVQ